MYLKLAITPTSVPKRRAPSLDPPLHSLPAGTLAVVGLADALVDAAIVLVSVRLASPCCLPVL